LLKAELPKVSLAASEAPGYISGLPDLITSNNKNIPSHVAFQHSIASN
jgi:hypothetical protein